ncbi:VLN2 [Symbiodinium sp. KB8]|nr:VLN2 [Symbiodinium sp. KB8]
MTVVLDDLLKDLPVQHREVEGNETRLFLSYFDSPPVILEGGIESGFNHVEEEEFKTRMLWVKGKGMRVRVIQCPVAATSLNHGDVFLVDTGDKIYQWQGVNSGPFEKVRVHERFPCLAPLCCSRLPLWLFLLFCCIWLVVVLSVSASLCLCLCLATPGQSRQNIGQNPGISHQRC